MNYQKIYSDFIESRSNRVITCYVETHHIMPKSLGGTNEKNNLIRLTPKEHFIAHRLLAKIHGGRMWAALSYMAKSKTKSAQGIKISSRTYEIIKLKDAKWRSEAYKGDKNPFFGKTFTKDQLKKLKGERPSISGSLNPNFGKKQSESTRAKIAGVKFKINNGINYDLLNRINNMFFKKNKELDLMNKKYGISQFHKGKGGKFGKENPNYGNGAAISGEKNPMFGKSHSEETRKKISEKLKTKTTCPNCLQIGSVSNMKRWHFDNCRK